MMHQELNGRKYVLWQTFRWAASVITILIIGSYALANSALMTGQTNALDVRELQTQYKSIDESLRSIKEALKIQ